MERTDPWGKIGKILDRCKSVCSFKNMPQKDKKELLAKIDKGRRFQTGNKFLGETEFVKYRVFNLPLGLTCPGKTTVCRTSCYEIKPEKMHKGKEMDSSVVRSRALNWFASLQEDFVEKMVGEIQRLRPKKNQEYRIRLHASGDFYSEAYFEKWLVICLATKLFKKDYLFTVYTKSFRILDNVLSDQERLKGLMRKAYEIAGQEYHEPDSVNLSDFNLGILASVMDDTPDQDLAIIEKYKLPKYIVTSVESDDLFDCMAEVCAVCSKCYLRDGLEDVKTQLRK